jgi:hypothetical protein
MHPQFLPRLRAGLGIKVSDQAAGLSDDATRVDRLDGGHVLHVQDDPAL